MSSVLPQTGSGTVRIDGVQVLRAIAAVLVVAGHAQTMAWGLARLEHGTFTRSTWLPWGAGVDLFFVISGFIMVYASRRLFGSGGGGGGGGGGGAGEFLRRRLVRVAPLYWLCTLAYLGIVILAHAKGASLTFGWPAIAASLLFIPYASYGPAGGMFPIYDLGWTLNYEMFFYLLFAGSIFLPRQRAVPVVLVVLAALVAIGGLAQPQAALRFWTQPILLDFALGVLVAEFRCRGLRWPAPLRLAVISLGVLVFVFDPMRLFAGPEGVTVPNGLARVFDAGAPAAAVLAAVVLGPDVTGWLLRPGVFLGDASYSIYLSHPLALIVLEKVVVKTGLMALIGPWPIVAAGVGTALTVGVLTFHFVEEPLTKTVQRLTRGRNHSPLAPTAPAAAVMPLAASAESLS